MFDQYCFLAAGLFFLLLGYLTCRQIGDHFGFYATMLGIFLTLSSTTLLVVGWWWEIERIDASVTIVLAIAIFVGGIAALLFLVAISGAIYHVYAKITQFLLWRDPERMSRIWHERKRERHKRMGLDR